MANNNIVYEYNDVVLVRCFQSIHDKYSPNTLCVTYSCLNSRFFDKYGVNFKGLSRLHKYLKQQPQLYVQTKSKTFCAKEMDTIILYLKEKMNPRQPNMKL